MSRPLEKGWGCTAHTRRLSECHRWTCNPTLWALQSQIHRGDWSTAHRPLAMLKNDDGWYPAFDTQRASKRCSRASQLTLPNDWPAALQHLTFCRLEPAGHVRFVPLPNASPLRRHWLAPHHNLHHHRLASDDNDEPLHHGTQDGSGCTFLMLDCRAYH